ncbi:MAG: hypothetical protein HQ559_16160, partial [Lentisphaerae bacterium]|nr:hypothetical protein [Lentisphaerota bacterium]
LDAYADGEDGGVFTSIRECDGIRYIAVINNLHRPGPYTEWTKSPDFQPYGKAQTATLYVKAPKTSALYEFTESTRLTAREEQDHLAVTLALPPNAGRLVCVYPAEMNEIRITTEPEYRLGQSSGLDVAILDGRRANVPGRQLIQVTISDPQGRVHDESGIYPVKDGQVSIPFRPALNDAAGEWRVDVRERTSGLAVTEVLLVSPAGDKE